MALNFKNLSKALMNRGGGAVAGGAASAFVDRVVPSTINPKIVAIGKIVVGAVAPEIAPKSEFVKYAGAGMAGAGASDLTKQLMGFNNAAPVSGIGADEYPTDVDMSGVDEDYMSGAEEYEQMSGTESDSPIGGVGEETMTIGDADIEVY